MEKTTTTTTRRLTTLNRPLAYVHERFHAATLCEFGHCRPRSTCICGLPPFLLLLLHFHCRRFHQPCTSFPMQYHDHALYHAAQCSHPRIRCVDAHRPLVCHCHRSCVFHHQRPSLHEPRDTKHEMLNNCGIRPMTISIGIGKSGVDFHEMDVDSLFLFTLIVFHCREWWCTGTTDIAIRSSWLMFQILYEYPPTRL